MSSEQWAEKAGVKGQGPGLGGGAERSLEADPKAGRLEAIAKPDSMVILNDVKDLKSLKLPEGCFIIALLFKIRFFNPPLKKGGRGDLITSWNPP